MNKNIKYTQIFFLVAGVIFSTFTTVKSIIDHYNLEGSFLKFRDCTYPNPLITPCFYGMIAFWIALFWAIKIFKQNKEYKGLMYFLIAGVIFAWGNFSYEVWQYIQAGSKEIITCSGYVSNPLESSCFYGSILFTISLLFTIILNKRK